MLLGWHSNEKECRQKTHSLVIVCITGAHTVNSTHSKECLPNRALECMQVQVKQGEAIRETISLCQAQSISQHKTHGHLNSEDAGQACRIKLTTVDKNKQSAHKNNPNATIPSQVKSDKETKVAVWN